MLEPHQDKAIRRAAVAGLFYPADPGELKSAVEELLANSKIKHRPGRILCAYCATCGLCLFGASGC